MCDCWTNVLAEMDVGVVRCQSQDMLQSQDQKEIEFTGLIMTPDGKGTILIYNERNRSGWVRKKVSNKLKEQGAYEIIKRLNEQH